MEKLTNAEGIKIIPRVWTVSVSNENDLYPNIFDNQALRFRFFFEKIKGVSEGLVIYFHLSDGEEEVDLSTLPSSVYVYGAFNQVSVCQIRSFGNIRKMTTEEKERFIGLIAERLKGKNIGDKLPIKPSAEEKAGVLLKLQSGGFYRFKPLDFMFHQFERG